MRNSKLSVGLFAAVIGMLGCITACGGAPSSQEETEVQALFEPPSNGAASAEPAQQEAAMPLIETVEPNCDTELPGDHALYACWKVREEIAALDCENMPARSAEQLACVKKRTGLQDSIGEGHGPIVDDTKPQ